MKKDLGLSLITTFVLATSGAAAANAACPCDSFIVPAQAPADINMQSGLAYSYTPECHSHFTKTAADAKRFCQQYLKEHGSNKRIAVVSDLDETLLDNREHFKAEPTKDWSMFEQWMDEARAPVLKPTADFLNWARKRGFAIFFVTGRPEKDRSGTIANLLHDQMAYDGLYMRPDDDKGPAQDYKSKVRQSIEELGFTIVVNIGDQISDLAGGHSLDCEKLPNRMYFIK